MSTFRPRATILAVVGALALLVAACGNGNDDPGPAQTAITLEGTDSLEFVPDRVSVAADQEVTVTLECGPAVEHDFIIEGFEGDRVIVHCDPGQTASGSFTIAAGTHTFYCSIPGHRESGMEGVLTAS